MDSNSHDKNETWNKISSIWNQYQKNMLEILSNLKKYFPNEISHADEYRKMEENHEIIYY